MSRNSRGEASTEVLSYSPASSSNCRSNLPRPQVSGKSESSSAASSTTATGNGNEPGNTSYTGNETGNTSYTGNTTGNTTNYYSDENADKESSDDDDILQLMIRTGLSKSKSEPVDLKRKQLRTRNKPNRSKSKSPRNSKIIPGVRYWMNNFILSTTYLHA